MRTGGCGIIRLWVQGNCTHVPSILSSLLGIVLIQKNSGEEGGWLMRSKQLTKWKKIAGGLEYNQYSNFTLPNV